MRLYKKLWIFLVFFSLCVTALSYFFLPEQIPYYENYNGRIEIFDKNFFVFMMIILIILFPLVAFISASMHKQVYDREGLYHDLSNTGSEFAMKINQSMIRAAGKEPSPILTGKNFAKNLFETQPFLLPLMGLSGFVLGQLTFVIFTFLRFTVNIAYVGSLVSFIIGILIFGATSSYYLWSKKKKEWVI